MRAAYLLCIECASGQQSQDVVRIERPSKLGTGRDRQYGYRYAVSREQTFVVGDVDDIDSHGSQFWHTSEQFVRAFAQVTGAG